MFGQDEEIVTVQHEILKENHEILEKNYQSLQEMMKHVEETNDVMKKHLQSRTEELEVMNTRLFEDCERERSEKKKLLEELKTVESQRKAKNDELMMKNEELEEIENKYVELEKKFGMVEKECSYLKSLYDAEVEAASDAIVSSDESDGKSSKKKSSSRAERSKIETALSCLKVLIEKGVFVPEYIIAKLEADKAEWEAKVDAITFEDGEMMTE